MKHFGFVLLFCTSVCFGQTTFDQSETLFNKHLFTDSTKAKVQLEYQRKHAVSKKDKTRYALNCAVFFSQRNRMKAAEDWLKKADKTMPSNDLILQTERVRIEALIYYRKSRFEESRKIINDFLKAHKSLPQGLKIKLGILLSENDIALGEFGRAHQRSLSAYKTLKKKMSPLDDDLKVSIWTELYTTCFYQAKYDSALFYLYQSESYLEEGSMIKATFYDRLAVVYAMNGNQQKAIYYYGKSIPILEKTGASASFAHTLYNLGGSLKEIGSNEAIPVFKKALRIARKANYRRIIGYAQEELGDLYLNKKDYVLAEKYNREALKILKEDKDFHGIINTMLNMGRLEYETGNYEIALNYLEEALEMAEGTNDPEALKYCYEYLYKSYEHKGDFKLAHKYHKLYTKVQREIAKAEVQENIEKLNLSYDIRVQKATNKLLKEEVNLKNKKLSAEKNVKWLLGTLIFILLIAGWFLRRFFMQRTKLKEYELQLTRSELKGAVQEKERTVEELDTVKDELTGKNDLIKELNKLLLENEQSLVSKEQFGDLITNDIAWVEFLAKLQLVFPDFTENLKTRHPGLSNNEFRLAALVRLSLSDKEISQLLIIEPASVKKAKNRLKQKLGLETNDKLSIYLREL
jgi:tetratricopeptide (TPR) repeat protein